MQEYQSESPESTRQIATEICREFHYGDVILLEGELGAGKTEFVKGVVEYFAPGNVAQSPTFSLLNVYSSEKMNLFHIDLYRLEDEEEIMRAGFEEYLEPDGITLIEWASRWPLSKQLGKIKISIKTLSENSRSIMVERLSPAK